MLYPFFPLFGIAALVLLTLVRTIAVAWWFCCTFVVAIENQIDLRAFGAGGRLNHGRGHGSRKRVSNLWVLDIGVPVNEGVGLQIPRNAGFTACRERIRAADVQQG